MPEMIEVTKEDANKYSLILAILGMDEEGDPVTEVKRLKMFYDRAMAEKTALVPPGGFWPHSAELRHEP